MGPKCHKRMFPSGIFNDTEVECDMSLLPGLFGATSTNFKSCIYTLGVLMKQQCTQRVVLRLSGNWLGYQGISSLEPSVRSLTNLRELHLSKNGLGPDGAKVLVSIMRDLPHIEVLDLRRNALGPEGTRRVFSCLRSNSLSTLRALDVSSNFMQDQGVEYVVFSNVGENLIVSLKYSHCITHEFENILIKRTTPTLEHRYVADAFRDVDDSGLSKLRVLRMSGNQISQKGSREMFEALSAWSRLKEEEDERHLEIFDFSYNTIGSKSTSSLGDFLTTRGGITLKSLNLRSCGLSSEGIMSMSHSVCKMKRLECLDISKNNVNTDAEEQLLTISKLVTTLKLFRVENNRLSARVRLKLNRRYSIES